MGQVCKNQIWVTSQSEQSQEAPKSGESIDSTACMVVMIFVTYFGVGK